VLDVSQASVCGGFVLLFMGVFTVCSLSSSRPVVEILCDSGTFKRFFLLLLSYFFWKALKV
jgi:hypothetical protein